MATWQEPLKNYTANSQRKPKRIQEESLSTSKLSSGQMSFFFFSVLLENVALPAFSLLLLISNFHAVS